MQALLLQAFYSVRSERLPNPPLDHAHVRQVPLREPFSVDGTLVEVWASMKRFRPKNHFDDPLSGGRNGERDFHGERRRNDTHVSTTHIEARLFRKGAGKEAKLSFMALC